jgi:hypothetical protein
MIDLIVPCFIAVGLLVGVGVLIHRKISNDRVFDLTLRDLGFVRQPVGRLPPIDLTITAQWPEARGMTIQKEFTKDKDGGRIRVANVCCVGTGVMYSGGRRPIMRVEEIRQTVVITSFPGLELPRFWLCPKDCAEDFRTLAKGGVAISTGDVVFDDTFFIIGPRHTECVRVLTPSVRAQILSLPDVMLASGKGSVIVFREGVVLPPEQLGAFVELIQSIRRAIVVS